MGQARTARGDTLLDRPQARWPIAISFLIAGFMTACWAPIAPIVKSRLGADDNVFALLLLCAGTGSVLSTPITGILVTRWGGKTMIQAGGVGLALMLPVIGAALNATMLAIVLFAFGASLGMIDVAMNAQAAEAERAAAKPLMSRFHALFSIGGGLGAGGMTLLLANGVWLMGATMIASALALLALVFATPGMVRAKAKTLRVVVPRGIVLILAGLAAATFLIEGAILDWGAMLINDRALLDPTRSGLGYTMFAIAMAAGRLTGDHLVGGHGRTRVLFWSGGVGVAGFVLLLLAPIAQIAVGGFVLIGLGVANIVPILFSLAGQQKSMPAPLALAAVTATGYAGLLAGPVMIGPLSYRMGLPAAFWVLAGLMMLVPLAARHLAQD